MVQRWGNKNIQSLTKTFAMVIQCLMRHNKKKKVMIVPRIINAPENIWLDDKLHHDMLFKEINMRIK